MPWFGHSHIKEYIESLSAQQDILATEGMNYYLLGDSGYNPLQIVLTPLRNAIPGTQEATYTQEHKVTRCKIEQNFGRQAAVWRVVKRERMMRYQPIKAAKIIIAAAVMHNFRILNGEVPLIDDPDLIFEGNDHRIPENYQAGSMVRQNIIAAYYA